MLYFNPRSPHGERQSRMDGYAVARQFQSTLPARGATALAAEQGMHQQFQSTLPARGATRTYTTVEDIRYISIHAPRTGSDAVRAGFHVQQQYISIHAPRTGSDGSAHSRARKAP